MYRVSTVYPLKIHLSNFIMPFLECIDNANCTELNKGTCEKNDCVCDSGFYANSSGDCVGKKQD